LDTDLSKTSVVATENHPNEVTIHSN